MFALLFVTVFGIAPLAGDRLPPLTVGEEYNRIKDWTVLRVNLVSLPI